MREKIIQGITKGFPWFIKSGCILFVFFNLLNVLLAQQGSIDYSSYIGGTGFDITRQVVIDNGETYIAAYAFSNDFPVTDGSTLQGGSDIVLMKYDVNNNLVYAKLFGGTGSDFPLDMQIVGDNIFLMARGFNSANFPTTDNSMLNGNADVIFMRIDKSTGDIELSTLIGGAGRDEGMEMEIEDDQVYLLVSTSSDDFPVTDGTTKYSMEDYEDVVLIKMDTAAIIQYATFLGPYSSENFLTSFIEVNQGEVYAVVASDFDNYPVTDGSAFIPDATSVISKIDTNGSVVYAKYLAHELSAEEAEGLNLSYHNGKLHFSSIEYEGNVDQSLVTNGTFYQNGINNYLWVVLDEADGRVDFGTYINQNVNEVINYNQNTYIIGEVDNETLFLTKYDSNYQITLSTTFPGDRVRAAYINEDGIYLLSNTSVTGLSTTNGSTLSTNGSDLLVTVLNHEGQVQYLSYLGGASTENPTDIKALNNMIHVIGYQSYNGLNSNYPVTNGSTHNGSSDYVYTKIDLCPTFPTPSIDTLSPSKQIVCKNGLVNQIKGTAILLPGDSLPTLFIDGIPQSQNDIEANYQWQEATTAMGPWTDITSATQRNYTPQPSIIDRYFRRLSLTNQICGKDTISISAIDSILVNTFFAPSVDAGGVFNTCPSVSVTLDATVTDGTSPYQYDWDMGATDIEDPIVAPTESTVFTLLVTDDNDCQQLGQAVVNTYAADAGGAIASACAGDSVQIGGTPIPGLAGVIYAWTPNVELSCTDCATPFANPTTTQTYNLELTIPITGGGTCQTNDQIIVSPITAPTLTDFAGQDITICRGATGTLGTALEYFPIPLINVTQSSISGSFTGTVVNLTDNNFTTGARTNSTSNASITIDLGRIYEGVAQVELAAINTANLNGGSRRIQVSTDNSTWSTVNYNISGTTNSSLTAFTFTNRDARYIRIQKGSGTGIVDLSEIRVYQSFNYTWAPGNYLTNNQTGQTTFQPGSLSLPSPDPILYYLTAEREGCTFVDEVFASVIEARAGVDGCGPRTVGEIDRTPNIQEIYEWVKISGPGNLIGVTNEPTAQVTASVGSDTEYEVRVTAGGTTCTDRVIVPPPCECVVDITVNASFLCPSLDLNESGVILNAVGAASPSIDPNSFVYTWSVISGPTGGLSTYTGAFVELTDQLERTFRVTLTSTDNPDFSCTRDIVVNNPAWSLPVFEAADVSVCANVPIQIGEPTVADYTYEWSPAENLSATNISMPTATINTTTDFVVTVTDTRSGCLVKDTVNVEVLTIAANAGNDILVCDNSTISLGGNLPQANATYAWSPAGANWQNGTDETDAQPEALVAINQEFRLEVTSTIGNCISRDTVMVTIGTPVSNFTLPDIVYCPSNGAVTIGTSVPAGFSIYAWSPASLLADATIQSPQTLDPPPSGETIYSVIVQNSSGCEYGTTQKIIPTISEPNAGSSKIICLGENTEIGSADNITGAGISYTWSGTAIADLSSTSSTNPIYTPTGSGVFTFTLSKDDNGCISTHDVLVTVNEFELPTIAPITICQQTAVEIGTTPETGVQYLWQPSTNLSDSTIANPIVSNLTTTTTYTLSAIGLNNCPASQSVLIGVNTIPAPTIMLNDTIICAGEATAMFSPSISPAGNYNFEWSPNDGSVVNVYNEQSEILIFGTGDKTYTLKVTNTDNGCSSSADAQLKVTTDCDWGDLPDSSNGLAQSDYQTTRSNNGPVHLIIPNLFLGQSVDGETDGQATSTALGDGTDEDGITIFSSMNLLPGSKIRLPFNYTNTTGDTAYLAIWIDWNANGDFEEVGENILFENDGNGNTPFPEFLEIDIPNTATTGIYLGMRVRLSHQANMTPYGRLDSGEVEDYLLGINCGSQICLPFESILLLQK